MPLRDGNYWVYQEKTLDTLDNVINISSTYDTITIVSDTNIVGIAYKKHTRQIIMHLLIFLLF
jgi:hypothetical protein